MTLCSRTHETSCTAHKGMCRFPECPPTCTGRAANWIGNPRFDFLEIAATDDGLHCDVAATSPEDRDWLEDQGLIRRDYNRYRATDRGLKALFPSLRVL
jgi:hypothetical protein